MSSRADKKIAPRPSSDKLEMIRSGKRKRSITGFKENKNIMFSNKEGKYIAVEKEKKFEEAGVTKKKRNFIMFESKLGTETETDLHKIASLRNAKPKDRVEEKIVITKKKKEYLDNYQYHETKNLKNSKPDTVIHQRWGDIIGGTFEETSIQKITTKERGKSSDKIKTTTQTQSLKQNKSTANLRAKPQPSATATKTMETTTRIGRRGGAGGKTSETTTTTKKETKTTTKGGERETKSSTRTTRTRK